MKELARKWLAVPNPPWSDVLTTFEQIDEQIGAHMRKYDRRRTGPLTLMEYENGKKRRATDKPKGDKQ